MIAKVIIGCSMAFFLCNTGWAQGGGEGGGGGGDSSSGQGGGSSGSTQSGQRSQQRQRPLFLSGKVVLGDGQEPGEQVRVELICNGTVMAQEYSSSNGAFSMELNQLSRQNALQPIDASISTTGYNPGGGFDAGLGGNSNLDSNSFGAGRSQNLSSCEIQATLSGYQSDILPLGPRRALDNPDIGVIVLHRLGSREGAVISLTSLAAPKDAKQAYEKAGKELIKKKPNLSKASKELEKAIKIYDKFAAAHYMLGEVRLAESDRSGATESFELAMTLDDGYASPRVSLAVMALEEELWQDAARLSEEALQIDPNHLRAHYCNAVANSSLGNIVQAEESALRVHDSADVQNYPLVHYVLGWIMSQRGDFDSAADQYRHFVETQPKARLSSKLAEQLADWEQSGLVQKIQ